MFQNRREAGQRLAAQLAHLKGQRPVVVALPRGGVPVGFEVAMALDAPLDVLVVRKLGAPGQPELAVGAVTNGGKARVFLDHEIVRSLKVPPAYLEREAAAQVERVRRLEWLLRGGRPAIDLAGRIIVLVDDGLATGWTARAALSRLQRESPVRLVLAVPVAPRETVDKLRNEVDELVCLESPQEFYSVGDYYTDFKSVSEEDVMDLLARANQRMAAA